MGQNVPIINKQKTNEINVPMTNEEVTELNVVDT